MKLSEIRKHRLYLEGVINANTRNRHELILQSDKTLKNMSYIANESLRVADIAHNSEQILDDLDTEFERRTTLNSLDQKFLWLTVALQCVRQYLLSNDTFRISSTEGDNMASKIIPKQWKDILLASVPYDAVRKINSEYNTGLSGYTHRYRTLGHDPVLGWVFGPMNILSDSLTKSNFDSYSVKNMTLSGPMPTTEVFTTGMQQVHANKYNLPTAVARQAIHFGSDYFTKQGLPIPFICTANNEIAKSMIVNFNIDMYSTARGAVCSTLINFLISFIHRLFYDKLKHGSLESYDVKTRKIIMYSNLISTTSNIIYAALNGYLGNIKKLKTLDAGGFIVTLHRIISDTYFVANIKREFITASFNNMIRGEEYDF